MTPFLCSILPFEPSSYDLRSLALSFLGKVETSTRMRSALSALGGVFSPFFFLASELHLLHFLFGFKHIFSSPFRWLLFVIHLFQSARLMFKYSDPLRIERQRAPFEAILQVFFVGMCRQTPKKGENTFLDLYNIHIYIYISIHPCFYILYPSIHFSICLSNCFTIQTHYSN